MMKMEEIPHILSENTCMQNPMKSLNHIEDPEEIGCICLKTNDITRIYIGRNK